MRSEISDGPWKLSFVVLRFVELIGFGGFVGVRSLRPKTCGTPPWTLTIEGDLRMPRWANYSFGSGASSQEISEGVTDDPASIVSLGDRIPCGSCTQTQAALPQSLENGIIVVQSSPPVRDVTKRRPRKSFLPELSFLPAFQLLRPILCRKLKYAMYIQCRVSRNEKRSSYGIGDFDTLRQQDG